MVENKKKSIHDLKLLTNEEIKKINKKFEQEETLIKNNDEEIKQLKLRIDKLKEIRNNLQIILAIEYMKFV